jgi:hypothetical protein
MFAEHPSEYNCQSDCCAQDSHALQRPDAGSSADSTAAPIQRDGPGESSRKSVMTSRIPFAPLRHSAGSDCEGGHALSHETGRPTMPERESGGLTAWDATHASASPATVGQFARSVPEHGKPHAAAASGGDWPDSVRYRLGRLSSVLSGPAHAQTLASCRGSSRLCFPVWELRNE